MSSFIILFGAPGVGKGTQAAILAESNGYAHFSTGDAFRAAIAQQTEIGKVAQGYVQSGGLVPDDVVAGIVAEALADPKFAGTVILDGYPRTVAQAEALAALVDKNNHTITRVVNIAVDEDSIVERLLARGRADDTEDIIRHRLSVYRQETAPLLEFYAQYEGVIANVDGNADVDTVQQRIQQTLA